MAENLQAFPISFPTSDGHFSPGMTLRDWFAGQALGHVLHAGIEGDLEALPGETAGQVIARSAYEMADFMLAERAKGGAK